MSPLENNAVFLSYASQDADAARRICEALRGAGVEVWFDQNELVGGDAWDAKIRKQIAECALFVPIISANTQARREGYFRIEWRLAAQRTHAMSDDTAFLLPVVIDDTRDADARVPAEFKAVQWTRLPAGETPDRFCVRVKEVLEGEGPEQNKMPAAAAGERPAARTAPRGFPRPGRRGWAMMAGATLLVGGAMYLAARWSRQPAPAITVAPVARDTAAAPETRTRADVTALLERVEALNRKTDAVRAELDTAVGLLEQAGKLDPANAEVWAAWALMDCRYATEWLDRSTVRFDLAQRHSTQAMGLDPKSPTARLARARTMTLLSEERATKAAAVALLEPLVEEPGDRANALILLASLKWDLGETDQALRYWERAEKFPGRSGQVHYQRATHYFFSGQRQQSLEAIERALAAEPAAKFLLWKSYLLMIWQGDSEGSRRVIESIPPAMFTEDFPATARYFVCLWGRDYEGAVAAMRAVPRDYLESGALTGPPGYYRGYALSRLNKIAAAETEWRAALDVVERRLGAQPNERRLLGFKALLLKSLGQVSAADKVWRAFRELHGESLDTWEDHFLWMEMLSEGEALDHLAAQVREGRLAALAENLRLDPFIDRLRAHPRFAALLAQAEADPRLSPKAGRASPPAAPAVSEKSLVVLPFENLSPDPSNAFFTEGMHVEIIATLRAVPELKVPSREAALALKAEGGSARDMARRAQVAHVLTGSVRREGNKVRLALELRRVSDDAPLWTSPNGIRELKDSLALQAEVAEEVARVLRARFDKGTFAGLRYLAADPRAYDAYLKAYAQYQQNVNRPASILKAVALMEEGMKIDPKFMPGARLLGRMYVRLYLIEADVVQRERYADPAKAWSELASNLVPGGAGDSSLAFYYGGVEQDPVRSRIYAENAVRVLPNDFEGHHYIGLALRGLGRAAEALPHLEHSIALDPINSPSWTALLECLAYLRRPEAFGACLEKFRATNPEMLTQSDFVSLQFGVDGSLPEVIDSKGVSRARMLWLWRGRRFEELAELTAPFLRAEPDQNTFTRVTAHCDALRWLGREAEAIAAAEKLENVVQQMNATRERDRTAGPRRTATAAARRGKVDEAIAAAQRAIAACDGPGVFRRWTQELLLAETYAYAGRARECVEVLAKLLTVPSGVTVPRLKREPTWDRVRDDPAFQALLADPKNRAPL